MLAERADRHERQGVGWKEMGLMLPLGFWLVVRGRLRYWALCEANILSHFETVRRGIPQVLFSHLFSFSSTLTAARPTPHEAAYLFPANCCLVSPLTT